MRADPGSLRGVSQQQPAAESGVAAPPVVYLPVDTDADGQVSEVKMIKLGDGRVALLGYTALDRFIDAWGDHQSWLLFETHRLSEIHDERPFDLKLLDVAVPEEFRRGPPQESRP